MLKKENYKINKDNIYNDINLLFKSMESVQRTILKGKVYAKIESVSKSGMSRHISFYSVKNNNIQNITPEIAWLTKSMPVGQYESYGKHLRDSGLKVGGCGMDMIFATLYNALGYEKAKNWHQRYNNL